MLDGGIDLDLDAVRQNIDEAEVVTLYFPLLSITLLLDTRSAYGVPAFMKLVPMARDAGDRLRSLRRLRPQLPRPESITMIPWTRSIAALRRLDIWEHIEERCGDCGEAGAILARLEALERDEVEGAVRGRGYETLWRAPSTIEGG
jgi:hypothetical protein